MKLNFKASPTISRFMQSNARRRVIMGPFGCLPASSEVMTTRGWVRMDAWAGEDVLQWGEDGSTKFVQPTARQVLPCEEFIRFDSGSLVMELSPEHRVPHWNWEGKFQVRTAAEISAHPSKRRIPTTFRAPETPGLPMSDDMIRFAVMMHADGHYPKAGQRASIVVRKERKKQRIRETLARIGVEWREYQHGSRRGEVAFTFEAPYVGKQFTSEWYQASPEQLAIVVDEVRWWDGLAGPDGDHPEIRYFSASREDANFIQYAAHATGRRASLGAQTYDDRPTWKPTWKVQICAGENAKNVAAIREHTRISRVPSEDGLKYCFTVPSGFFVARHEGTVFVTGNSGKSSGSIVEIAKRAMQQRAFGGIRKTRCAIVRNTLPQLRDTTIKSWMDWFPNGSIGHWSQTTKTYWIKQEGLECEVMFRALDDEADLKNLLSVEYSFVWMNECREIPQAIVEGLDGRIGRYPAVERGGVSWRGLWGDTNPPEEDSYWGYIIAGKDPETGEEVVPHQDKHTGLWIEDNGWDSFIQPGGLDPDAENLQYLDGGRDYYVNLAKGKPENSEYVKVYVNGQFGSSKAGKPIHPLFRKGVHVAKKELIFNKNLPLIIGADFGLTPAITLKQQNTHGQVLTLDEIVTEDMGLERAIGLKLKPLLARKYAEASIFVTGDPAGNTKSQNDEKTCADIFRAANFKKVKFATTNDPVARTGATDYFLGTMTDVGPMFLVDPGCKFYIKGLESGYHYKIDRKVQVSPTPNKNIYSHVCEAGHYTDMYFKSGGLGTAAPMDSRENQALIASIRMRRGAYTRR